MPKKVKFGIMCQGYFFPKWQALIVQNLLALENVQCELLIVNPEEETKKNLIKRYTEKFLQISLSNLFWSIYKVFVKSKMNSLKPFSLEEKLNGVKQINCKVKKKGRFSEYFDKNDVENIKDYQLDFILRFSYGIIRGEILNSAKYGIWSFHHGDEKKYRGGPACFWEIYNKDNITGFILQKLTNSLDAGIVLKKGYIKTNLSYSKNLNQALIESTSLAVPLCVDILNDNVEAFFKKPSITKAKILYAPSNTIFLRYFILSNYRNLISLKRIFFVDIWNIGVVESHITSFLNETKPNVNWFDLKGRKEFFADPFGILDKGDPKKVHIYFESYNHVGNVNKGEIDSLSYANGYLDNRKKIFNFPNHLSYPYIYNEGDAIYMIPENFESNQINLYKKDELIDEFKFKQTLVSNFSGVDSTLVKIDNKYWLFTSDKNNSPEHNLYIFYSENLFTEFLAHPKNPVKTDVRSSRSAGTPFVIKNILYRPSMDYSEKLEGKIRINEVKKISQNDFQEEEIKIIEPYKDSFYSDKIHTLSSVGNYTLIDGAKEVLVFSSWKLLKFQFFNIKAKIKKKFL